ncbi:MAG: extracellular solute-binding protein [Lentisphaerota bacterium]
MNRAALIGTLGFLIAFQAGAGWIEDRDGTTVIHVKLFDLPDPSRIDPATRADAAAVREFKRKFPEIFKIRYRDTYAAHPEIYGQHDWSRVEVELHKFSGIKVEGVESALLAIAGKVSPDVMYVNFRQSDTYIQQGFLYPLDKPGDHYLDSMPEEEQAFRIHPKIWPVIKRKGPQGEKHVWAIPYGGALGRVVLYRKDMFDEAGIPYPTNNWTWETFYEACKKLTIPSRGVYGLGMGRGKHESWYWTSFLWSAGGEALVYDETNNVWSAAFDSREAAVALDFYTRLCTEPWKDPQGRKRYGYVLKDASEAFARWDRGQIGMMFAYIDSKLFSVINPDITGMAPVPIGPGGDRGAELNSRMMGLFADIRDPAVRDAAWEYIRFFDSQEAVRIKTRVMVEGGLGRFINPYYLRTFGYPEIIRLCPQGWEECFKIAIASGRPEPYGKDSNYAYNIMTQPLREAEEAALLGHLSEDPEQRLGQLQGYLQKAVKKANEEMLGLYSPGDLLRRRISAVVILLIIVAVFSWALKRIIRAFTPPGQSGAQTQGWGFRKYSTAYLLLAPALLTILVWHYIPILRGSFMAFMDYKIMGGSEWVWLDNFGHALWSPDWWTAIWNSTRYSFLVITLTFLPPVILAIFLQEIPKGKIVFRMIYYLPAIISGLVVILLWKSFYDPSERGALNALLLRIPALGFLSAGLLAMAAAWAFARRLFLHGNARLALVFSFAGIALFSLAASVVQPLLCMDSYSWMQRLFMTLPEPVRWLDQSSTAMFSCVLPMAWAGMGPGSLIYLAALKNIPDEFYEAADIDGATFVDKILFIIFPLLKPLLTINFIGVFIASWNAEANILAMTAGASGTEVAGLHIFYKAFIFLKFGPATAMAWMLGVMLIGFTMYQLTLLSRMEFKTASARKDL